MDGQPWSMGSTNALRCSSSRVAILILSVVMQSSMAVNDSIALMVMCVPSIFISVCHVVVPE